MQDCLFGFGVWQSKLGPKENWRPVCLLTAEEVQYVVPQIKTKKSIGPDGLEGNALKKNAASN